MFNVKKWNETAAVAVQQPSLEHDQLCSHLSLHSLQYNPTLLDPAKKYKGVLHGSHIENAVNLYIGCCQMGKGVIAAVAPCFATQLLSVFMPKVMSARKVLERSYPATVI